MELYFLRHGDAVERSEWGMKPDSERPLTPEGVEKMKKGARGMRDVCPKFGRVISSPYARALETARLAVRGMDLDLEIETSEALVPNAAYGDFLKLILNAPEDARWLFTGHEPSMSDIIGNLVSRGKGAGIAMKKGGLALVEGGFEGGRFEGLLQWLLTPRQLRNLV